jgi:hypothetical protein
LARGLRGETSRAEAPSNDPLQLLQPRRARPARHGRRWRLDPRLAPPIPLRFGGKCSSLLGWSAQRGGGGMLV